MSLTRFYCRHERPLSAPGEPRAEQSWQTADDLVSAVAGGEPDASAWYRFFKGLEFGGWDLRVSDEHGALFEARPAPPGEGRQPVRQQAPFRLSRFALVRRADDGVQVESPLARSRVVLFQPDLASRLFAGAGDGCPSGEEPWGALADVLVAAGLGAENDQAVLGSDHPLGMWEFHDLLACASSYPGVMAGPVGGTYRFRGQRAPLPLVRPARGGKRLPLPEPGPDALRRLAAPFGEVLGRRRSIRRYASPPPDVGELGALLHLAARLRDRRQIPDGGDAGLRTSPSGGGLHPIDILPAVRDCPGLPAGLYRYDPGTHELETISAPSPAFERLFSWNGLGEEGSGFDPVPILLLLTARFGRTAWKYQGLAWRLVHADLGCLEQTLYLGATALGLAPCAIGGADPELLAEVTGVSRWEEPMLGEFALGRA
jgi:oxazoline/thiazoline dehydrogenase